MEEEISLREIIETLLNGKWIIAGITAFAVLLSGIFSFFLIEPTYQTKSTIMINNLNQSNGALNGYLNDMVSTEKYMAYLQSPQVLQKTIDDRGLDRTTSSLENAIELNNEEKSNLISISITGKDRKEIPKILSSLILNSKEIVTSKIQSQVDTLLTEYQNEMDEQQKKLNDTIDRYNELKAGAGLPTLILFQNSASGSQYTLEANRELLEELRNLQKEDQVQYEKINHKINKLTNMYNNYYGKYEDAQNVDASSYVDNKVTILSESMVPENPVSPNKKLNVAIGLVIGLMIGIGVVFLMSYWRNTDQNVTKNQGFKVNKSQKF